MAKLLSPHYRMFGWLHRAFFWAGTVLVAVAALPVFLNGAETIRFKGTVRRGESFRHKVTDGLIVANQNDYQVLHNAYEALDRNSMTAEQVSSEISQHGHARTGKLNITGLSLGNLHVGSQPAIKRMDFMVELDIRSR